MAPRSLARLACDVHHAVRLVRSAETCTNLSWKIVVGARLAARMLTFLLPHIDHTLAPMLSTEGSVSQPRVIERRTSNAAVELAAFVHDIHHGFQTMYRAVNTRALARIVEVRQSIAVRVLAVPDVHHTLFLVQGAESTPLCASHVVMWLAVAVLALANLSSADVDHVILLVVLTETTATNIRQVERGHLEAAWKLALLGANIHHAILLVRQTEAGPLIPGEVVRRALVTVLLFARAHHHIHVSLLAMHETIESSTCVRLAVRWLTVAAFLVAEFRLDIHHTLRLVLEAEPAACLAFRVEHRHLGTVGVLAGFG